VAERQPDFVSYQDWKRIEALENRRGEPHGRPRVKFTTVRDALDALRDGRP
jgi:ferredoxin--NADP+ reductase